MGVGLRTIDQGYSAPTNSRQGYGLTETDPATGLDHTWFRKNENRAGRFTSPDPYKGSMSLASSGSFNRYSYVENQPTNFIDPSGLIWVAYDCWCVNGDVPGWTDPNPRCDTCYFWLEIGGGGGGGGPIIQPIDIGGGGGNGGGISVGGSPNSNPDPCPNSQASAFGARNDAAGGVGEGMKRAGGTFRTTNGAYNGNQYSPNHYPSNWQGGSRAQITTFSMTRVGSNVARGTAVVGAAAGGIEVYDAYQSEGRFGPNTQVATGSAVGGFAGGAGGAKVGTVIGAAIGNVPGAIIGGVVGGVVGGFVGSSAGRAAVCAAQ